MTRRWITFPLGCLAQAAAYDWMMQAGALRADGGSYIGMFLGAIAMSIVAIGIFSAGERK
ncbi:hypothetical protein [Methylobrevis pamukkalensis]|uniref:Uncharacterized protein n=1 Tax=Methylobrevis pamukkalensis TaxID=1439726 RepID=A0A1E3H9N9_9HYPH|nr:hypothetical protein [Methylobrevis pamukkalensis]ODN72201.1 hypothetical protein A6302_00499 [Methylobrevis pamukkalensis]